MGIPFQTNSETEPIYVSELKIGSDLTQTHPGYEVV